MVFPDNMLDVIRQSEGSERSLLSLELIPFDHEETSLSRLQDWSITSVDSEWIKIKLQFEAPLEVSQGEESDLLFILANLQAYPDVDGLTLPQNFYQEVALPKLFASDKQQQTLSTVREAVASSAKSAVALNGVLQLVMNASANQLWSALNNQQIIVMLPLLEKLNFPLNVETVNQAFIMIATFELMSVDDMNGWLYGQQVEQVAVNEPYNGRWEETGFESQLFVFNMGFPMWVIYAHLAIVPISAIVLCFQKMIRREWCDRYVTRLRGKLFWNSFIRLFMELYMDLALTAVLNVLTADWASPLKAVKYSNAIAVSILVLAVVAPFLLVRHYILNWHRLQEPEFT